MKIKLVQIGREFYTVDGVGKKKYTRMALPIAAGIADKDQVTVFMATADGEYSLLPGDLVVRKRPV